MNEPTLEEIFPAWKEQTQQSKLILNNTTELGELGDDEAHKVIQAIEPILKNATRER